MAERSMPEPASGANADALPSRPVAVLFATLVLLVFFAPLAGTTRLPALNVLFTLVIVAAINLTSGNRRTLKIGFLLGIPALVFAWLGRGESTGLETAIRYLIFDLLLLQVFVLMMRAVLKARRVTSETVHLGLSCYLLLGLLWAAAYATLELLQPGSLNLSPGLTVSAAYGQASYFSFVTLTTVGYGDILPVTPVARGMANLEAVAGVLFVGVFIARLIAAYEMERR
jgi:hypothetical protein